VCDNVMHSNVRATDFLIPLHLCMQTLLHAIYTPHNPFADE
jgi:hypothetical protein